MHYTDDKSASERTLFINQLEQEVNEITDVTQKMKLQGEKRWKDLKALIDGLNYNQMNRWMYSDKEYDFEFKQRDN